MDERNTEMENDGIVTPAIMRLADEVAEMARLAIRAGHRVVVLDPEYVMSAGPDGAPLRISVRSDEQRTPDE